MSVNLSLTSACYLKFCWQLASKFLPQLLVMSQLNITNVALPITWSAAKENRHHLLILTILKNLPTLIGCSQASCYSSEINRIIVFSWPHFCFLKLFILGNQLGFPGIVLWTWSHPIWLATYFFPYTFISTFFSWWFQYQEFLSSSPCFAFN